MKNKIICLWCCVLVLCCSGCSAHESSGSTSSAISREIDKKPAASSTSSPVEPSNFSASEETEDALHSQPISERSLSQNKSNGQDGMFYLNGVYFVVPLSWRQNDSEDEASMSFSRFIGVSDSLTMRVADINGDYEISDEDNQQKLIDSTLSSYGNVESRGTFPQTIAGLPAYVYCFYANSSRTKLSGRVYMIADADKLVTVLSVIDKDSSDSTREVFSSEVDSIVSSINFTGPPETDPVSSADRVFSVEDAARLADELMAKNFDDYTVSHSENTITINLAHAGLASEIYMISAGQTPISAWDEVKQSMISLCNSITATLSSFCDDSILVVINLLNDQNRSNVLLTVYDGVVVVDCLE